MRLDGELPEDRGSPDRTHVFVFDDVVVKLNQQPGSKRLVRERNALALLQSSSLRVPEFIADGESVAKRAWIAMTRLAGVPPADALIPPEQVSVELAVQLGEVTAQLHNGPRPPGFGTWTEGDVTLARDVESRVDALHKLGVDAQIVERSELDALADLLRDHLGVLDSAPSQPVLAHRDIQPRNVLVDDHGVITALLDFESAAGGDPAHDFSTIGLDWRRPGFRAFTRGYREAGGPIDDAFAERVAYHVGFWCLAVLAYLGGFLPHFLPVARDAIERIGAGDRPPL